MAGAPKTAPSRPFSCLHYFHPLRTAVWSPGVNHHGLQHHQGWISPHDCDGCIYWLEPGAFALDIFNFHPLIVVRAGG